MVIIVVVVIVVCNGNHITELLVTIITECDKLGRRGKNDSSSGGCNGSRCNRGRCSKGCWTGVGSDVDVT